MIFAHFSKDLQILTTSRHLVHFNLQIALGLTQIAFLAGGATTHMKVGNACESQLCCVETVYKMYKKTESSTRSVIFSK
jgi:hypothetical protein